MVKNKIQKEIGKVKFSEKITLSKSKYGGNLEPFNLEHFDKKMLEYKKHFLFITENSIIVIGYNSFKDKIDNMYQKKFDLNNVEKILLGYKTKKWTERGYDKQTNYKKVTNVDTGRTYTEEIKEDVPYEVERQKDIFTYGEILFKNIDVQSMIFSFISTSKSLDLVNKIIKLCAKLNINCQTIQEE